MRSPTVNALVAPLMVPSTRARLDPVAPGDARVDAVWRDARARIGLGTVRDARCTRGASTRRPRGGSARSWSWTGARPSPRARSSAWGGVQRIVELIAAAERWGEALRAICAHARGCDTVELRLTPEQAAAHGLARHGFLERGGGMPLNVVLPEGEPKADVFWDPRRWYVTWLETDQDTTS